MSAAVVFPGLVIAVRTCIFVDGENFRYSLEGLFSNFSRQDYLPKTADWTALFDWMVQEVTGDRGRIRTYWYVIRSMDFYPYQFPNAERDGDKLRRLLSNHEPYKDELDRLPDNDRPQRMERMVTELRSRQDRMRRRFDGWIKVQDGISARHDAVEFRRAGVIQYDLYTETLGPEKAVDVKLATDMIVLREIYDVAIILSGDQDYVPAVEVVKDSGRRVVNVAFQTRGGKLLPGGARRLNQVTDRSLIVNHQTLASYLGL